MEAERIALVTGASRGIGAGIADHLAEDGFVVVGTATTPEGASSIEEHLGAGRGVVMQIGDDDSVTQALAEIEERFGSPTVLVNNAGVTQDNLLMRMSPEQWQQVININLTGLYRVTKPLLRGMMKARWGRIISMSSVVGRMGNPGQANYAASKAGIEGFTRSLAAEVGSRGITVNAVAPGFIETDMTNELTDEQQAEIGRQIALGRMGSIPEVAAVVAFLAGEEASYITGETLQVNGGMYRN